MDWESFKSGEIAVSISAREVYKEFMQECENEGILWTSLDKPTEVNLFQSSGCCIGCCKDNGGRLLEGSSDSFTNIGYRIITYEEFKTGSRFEVANIFDYLDSGVE